MYKNHKDGFTLLELLVVIAIIGMFATIVIITVRNANAQSRDAKRQEDSYQLRNALESYFADHGDLPKCGNYESGGHGYTVRSLAKNNYDLGWKNCLAPALKPYLSPLPTDPTNYSWYYFVCYANPGDTKCGDHDVTYSDASGTHTVHGGYLNITFETRTPANLIWQID